MKVIITSKKHPHYNETGKVKVDKNGNVLMRKLITGSEMLEITLDNCPHGTRGCFATKSDVKTLKDK